MNVLKTAVATVTGNAPANKHLLRLRCTVQDYGWGKPGSSSLAAKLAPEAVGADYKIDPEHTYAEIWMGTHKAGPAHLFSSPHTTLSSVIESDPAHYLGQALLDKWPGALDVPFLFKILSIAKALPLQAHPDKELGAKLHKKDPEQFVDANHKPEIAVAIGGEADAVSGSALGSDFERVAFTGFVGFQPLDQIAHSVKSVPELRAAIADDSIVDAFVHTPSADTLRALYARLLQRGKDAPDDVKTHVETLVRRVASAGWGEAADEATAVKTKLIVRVNEQYPGDVGVLAVPLFMNLVRLRKGEAVYIGADEIHAYLEGDIIECMAVSDNVVNAAFVPPEERETGIFADMLTYTSREPSHWALSNKPFARSGSEQTTAFSPPLEEFDVLRTELRGARETLAPARGPTIGIVTGGGSARFSAGGEEVVLPEGGVVYVVPGVEVAVELAGGAGEGEVWWATSSI